MPCGEREGVPPPGNTTHPRGTPHSICAAVRRAFATRSPVPQAGSPNGEAEVQVTTEGTRVFLSGVLANRAYVMVTIFDELDNVGRHIAVMSRHESVFSYALQFLGTCE